MCVRACGRVCPCVSVPEYVGVGELMYTCVYVHASLCIMRVVCLRAYICVGSLCMGV